ncbi:MAG: hypothetical protein AB3N10_16270, partial [Allomuricauda sp.]
MEFLVLRDYDFTLEIDSIINLEKAFKSPEEVGGFMGPDESFWIQIDLKNDLDTLDTNRLWRLRTPTFGYADLFYRKNDSLAQFTFCTFNMTEEPNSILYHPGVPCTKENLIEGRYLYLRTCVFNCYANIKSWEMGYLSEESIKF